MMRFMESFSTMPCTGSRDFSARKTAASSRNRRDSSASSPPRIGSNDHASPHTWSETSAPRTMRRRRQLRRIQNMLVSNLVRLPGRQYTNSRPLEFLQSRLSESMFQQGALVLQPALHDVVACTQCREHTPGKLQTGFDRFRQSQRGSCVMQPRGVFTVAGAYVYRD